MTTATLSPRVEALTAAIAAREGLEEARLKDFRQQATATRAAVAASIRAAKGHALLSAFADTRREVVRVKVEAAVQAAVRAVFGPRMAFRLDVRTVRGQVTMEPQVGYVRGSAVSWVGMDAVGGGVADVVSFAVRVAVLARYRPKLRRVLVADEPFKHVSAGYLPAVASMLRELSRNAGVQIIVVSHEPEIASAADRVYDVTMSPGGVSAAAVRVEEPAE